MLVPIMEVDLFELANNHLWQTNFGFKQWTLPSIPEYMNLETDDVGFTEWGWTDFGFQSYYALLNCGFPLRVSAGTASGVHPVQLGFGRVYVHLEDGFSYSDWIQGLDAGRSFVSTGPMLEVTFNGEDPGHRFTTRQDIKSFSVEMEIVASSRRKLGRIEIVAGGQVTETIAPPNVPMDAGGLVSHVKTSINVVDSTWIAVRCFEDHPEGRVRFAHTNPVFVDIPDRPLRPRQEEVGYLMQRMREEIARNRDVLDATSVDEYRQVLTLLERIAETAR